MPPAIPTFVDKARLAHELSIGETTVEEWVADGTLPPAHIRKGRVIRWHWATIEAQFAPRGPEAEPEPEYDPYMHGVRSAAECAVGRFVAENRERPGVRLRKRK